MKKNNCKSCTLTFHYVENYGAVLQAFALQKKIKELGHENIILNYKSKSISNSFSFTSLRRKGVIRYFLGVCYWFVRRLRKAKFDRFRSSMSISKKINQNDLSKINFDKFIVGSDQVWNHDLLIDDKTYLLNFVKDYNKKASYAASFGFEQLNDNYRSLYQNLINDFKFINVRESSGIKIIKNLSDKNVSLTLDPTFLLTKNDWEEQCAKPLFDEKYILTYQVTSSNKLIKIAKYFKNLNKTKVVSLPFPIGGVMFSKIDLFAGPREWLSYIQNCNLLITDSFHGVALSIILNKPFKVVLEGLPTRIINILNLFGLEEHIISDDYKFNKFMNYDWDYVNNILDHQRKQSVSILSSILTD